MSEPTEEGITYYGRSVVKEPVWIWSVPAYFYVGGAAGAAQVLGAAVQLADRDGGADLIKKCRRIAAVGTSLGGLLLIIDLGRPERFLNMLRVFRPTSAMSMGSWVLATSGPLATTSAVLADRDGALGAVGDIAGLAAGPAGLPLSGYTAVLLADTAVPLWQETRRTIPPLFVASALSSATSLLEMSKLDASSRRVVQRLGIAGKSAELIAMFAVEKDACRTESVGRPLKQGLGGNLWKVAKVATAAGVVTSLMPGGSRTKRMATGLLGTAGSLALRFALFHAGKDSSRDPHATFQRS